MAPTNSVWYTDVMSAITQEKRLTIEKAVEQIKLDTGLSYPENNLLEIANQLGAKVEDATLPDFNGKKVKGYIKWFTEAEKDANPGYSARILLNTNQSATVKNFTLAHEIGHFLLHQGEESYRIDLQDYSHEGDPHNQETEANFFAGTLLMPKDKFFIALRESKNLDQVAKAFGVSKPAVEARLKWLGLSIA